MSTLRAELSASAREARDDARFASASARDTATSAAASAAAAEASEAVREATTSLHSTISESRSDSRAQVQRAEVLLAEFRQDLRTELRGAAARGTVTSAVIDELEAGLSRLRADIGGTLG